MRTILRCLCFGVLLMCSLSSRAQISIASLPYTYTQAFTGFTGYISGLPAGWSAAGTFTERGVGNGSSTTGGMWGYGSAAPDYSLGVLCSTTSSSLTYKVSFRNNSGMPVNALTISYQFKQWRVGGGNTNGFTAAQTGIGASVSGLSQPSSNSLPAVPTVTPKSVNLTGLNILPNAVFEISWTIGDGGGSDNPISIDNFSLTAVTTTVTPPMVTTDPVNDTTCGGAAASFSVAATNASGYQWQEYNSAWANLSNTGVYSGTTTNTLAISNTTGLNGRQYRAIATGAPNDTSAAATLLARQLPAITLQPLPAVVCAGTDTVFKITATVSDLTYQWQVDQGSGFINIANNTTYQGSTTHTLQLTSPAVAMDGYRYRCIVSGSCAPPATSTDVLLTVHPLPVAAITPASGFSYCTGDSITLTTASGTGLVYQWFRNGTLIGSALTNTYKDTASGIYNVVLANAFGCTDTSAFITATAVWHSGSIAALSTASFCTGDSVILKAATGAGFTYQWFANGSLISGSVSDTIIVRSSGSYKVVVTNSIGCKDTSIVITTQANAGPVANITPLSVTTFCAGDSVVLDAGFIPGLSYQWLLNGTPISTATSDKHTAKASGSYTVKVATASTCFTYSAAVPVVVNALPNAPLFNSTAPVLCNGDSVFLSTNAGLTYQWKKDGTILAGTNNDTLIVKLAGTYKVTVTDGNSCVNTSDSLLIKVNPLPVSTVTPSSATSICQRDSLLLQANTGALLTYQWYKDGVVISGTFNNNYKAGATGNYRVYVTDSNGCSLLSAGTQLTVNALPSVTASLSGATTFCDGGNVVITVPSATGLSYQWFLNGTSVAGTTASYAATLSGLYRVVISNTTTGCKDTSNPVNVTVHPLPVASLTASTPIAFCDGDSVILRINTGTGLSYKWLYNTIPMSGVTGTQYTAKISGDYAVVVTDSNTCSRLSNVQQVVVHPLPNSHITYSSPLFFCEGGAVVLIANGGNGTTYEWLKDGLPQGITTYSNIVSQTGLYSVIETNIYNCTKTSPPLSVTVWPRPNPVVTRNGMDLSTGNYVSYQWFRNNQPVVNATTRTIKAEADGGYNVEVVDSNGCHTTSQIVFVNNVSVGQVNAASIHVYPNPVHDVLHVSAPFPVKITLSDVQGRIVSVHDEAKDIEIRNLAAGVYFLKIMDKHNVLIKTEKITKVND